MIQMYKTKLTGLLPFILFGVFLTLSNVSSAQTPPAPATPVSGSQTTLPNPQDAGKAQNPQSLETINIELGNVSSFKHKTTNAFYYDGSYKSQQIIKNGSPPSFTNVNAPVVLANPANAGGDTSSVLFNLQQDQANLKGPLLNTLGLQPFQTKFGILDQLNLRGAVQVSAHVNSRESNAALGVETHPYHPLLGINQHYKFGITNWLVFGANVNRQTPADASKPIADTSQATYRTFIGQGFGWKRTTSYTALLTGETLKRVPDHGKLDSEYAKEEIQNGIPTTPIGKVLKAIKDKFSLMPLAAPNNAPAVTPSLNPDKPDDWKQIVQNAAEVVAPDSEAQARKEAPNFRTALEVHNAVLEQVKQKQLPSNVDAVIYTLVEFTVEPSTHFDSNRFPINKNGDVTTIDQFKAKYPEFVIPTDANWVNQLNQAIRVYELPPDHPTSALWLEGSGWYDFSGSAKVGNKRFQNLFAATYTYWLDAKQPDRYWLSLRYENGRSRSAPSEYQNSLAVSLGTSF